MVETRKICDPESNARNLYTVKVINKYNFCMYARVSGAACILKADYFDI
jgi:hypothetical protein